RSVFLSGDQLNREAIAGHVSELGAQARQALEDPEAELRVVYELRYRGQAFELPIAAAVQAEPAELRMTFEAEHLDRYGYSDSERSLELVTIRVTATAGGVDIALAERDGETELRRGRRTAIVDGAEVEL